MKIPKVVKKTDGLTVFFALLGSARVKAAHKIIVNFINILRTNFSYVRRLFACFFHVPRYVHMYVKKAAKKTFVRKICGYNVNEIDTRCWSTASSHRYLWVPLFIIHLFDCRSSLCPRFYCILVLTNLECVTDKQIGLWQ